MHASAPTLTRAPEKNSEPLTGPAAPASSDLSFGGAAKRKKIAFGELERIAMTAHHHAKHSAARHEDSRDMSAVIEGMQRDHGLEKFLPGTASFTAP